MILRELRKAVRDRNGIPESGDALAGHTDINDAIRAALTDISSVRPWPWLLTSTAITIAPVTGEPTVALPDYTSIAKLVVNDRVADHVGLDAFTSNTQSCVWADFGNTIRLSPAPSANLAATLWYYRNEPDLADDEDAPLLPSVHHQTLIAKASYHLNVRRGRPTEQARDDAQFQVGIARMMQVTSRTGGPRTVRSAYGSARLPARWS